MKDIKSKFLVPVELQGEDVYNIHQIFDNESEAISYLLTNYDINKESFLSELHEEDAMRDKFGKEEYLRSAEISLGLYLRELMNGEYVLWEAY